MLKKTIIPALMGTTLLMGGMFSENANATFLECSGTTVAGDSWNIGNNVTPNAGCTILDPLNGKINDSVDPPSTSFTVNVQSFFDSNDWLYNGKNDIDEGNETSTFFNFTGNGQAGSFSLASGVDITGLEIMLVFKDGDGTNLVGYLYSGDGTYTSPFEAPPFPTNNNATKNVSHISVYYHEGGTRDQELPEPGMLILLSVGLVGFGLSRRRRV